MDNLKGIKKMIGDKTCPPECFHIGCFQEKGEEFFNFIKEDLMNAKYLRSYCFCRTEQEVCLLIVGDWLLLLQNNSE